jgi:hypothetical protein
MSDDSSALPLVQPGQAQKEMVHNEAIARIDLIVQAVALASLDTPPTAPESGQSPYGSAPIRTATGRARPVNWRAGSMAAGASSLRATG